MRGVLCVSISFLPLRSRRIVITNSFVEHPAIVEDALAYDKDNEELKEGAVDTESRGLQAELELNSLLSVADGQTYNTDGREIVTASSMAPCIHRGRIHKSM